MTSAGYAGYVSKRVAQLKNMSTSSSWMNTFSKESHPEDAAIYKSLKKAVKYRAVHQQLQFGDDRKAGRQYEDDSDD